MADIASEDGRAVFVGGHWEIEPSLLGSNIPLPRQEMNLAERQRIIAQRLRYLEYMHDHFADGIVAPPVGVATVAPAIETGH
jgi:hypothetical protein